MLRGARLYTKRASCKLACLARSATLLRRQPLVDEPGQRKHALRMVGGGLQRPLDGAGDAAAVVGFGYAPAHLRVVTLQYLREFGERLLLVCSDNVGCFMVVLLSSGGLL